MCSDERRPAEHADNDRLKSSAAILVADYRTALQS
jgi:hypothetical protein